MAALFVAYAWESRRGAFTYRPSWLELALIGLVLALVAFAPESVLENIQDRGFLPIALARLALVQLRKAVRRA